MKKTILLLSLAPLLMLALSSCGSSMGLQGSTNAVRPVAPVIAEPIPPTDCPEPGSAGDPATPAMQEAVCDLGTIQFSLSLPETWRYESRTIEDKYNSPTDAIVFWNTAYPGDVFTLTYAPLPGICGTGVTIEEITLSDGTLSGWKYTEIFQTEQEYWMLLTLSDATIPLQGNILQLESTLPLKDWEALEADFNTILDTICLQYTESTP